MSVFSMPPPPPRKPLTPAVVEISKSPPENSTNANIDGESDTDQIAQQDYDEVQPSEVYTLASLSEELQHAYRWAKLAFESQDGNNCGADPLALDAFEKGSKNLVLAASKLVDRETFAQILKDQGFDTISALNDSSNPASPPCEETHSNMFINEQAFSGDIGTGAYSQSKEDSSLNKSKTSLEGSQSNARSPDDFHDLKQYITDRSELPRFADIASLESPKGILREAIIFPLLHPHLFQGIRQPWKGILLHGPPGTGKTELAKAVAGECDASFVLISPSTLLSKFVGESERMMARIFDFAKTIAPTVLFFDEIDALGLSRSADGNDQGFRRLMAELLVQFNLLKASHRVTILAATNRIEDIDGALLRRFERRIEIGLLPENERAKLIQLKMKGIEMESDIDFISISRDTEGYSGADLELLCREAAMFGVRELMQAENLLTSSEHSNIRPVCSEDFSRALQVIYPTSSCQNGPALTTHEPEHENTTRRKRSAESRSGHHTPQFSVSESTIAKKTYSPR